MNLYKKTVSWISKLSKSQKILGSIGIFVIIVVLFSQLKSNTNNLYDEQTVNRGEIFETITISGNVTTSGSTVIYSPFAGVVEQVLVENESSVKQGQDLIKIKGTATDIERANALSAYQTAKAALSTAKQTKIVNQALLEKGRKTIIDSAIVLDQLNEKLNVGENNPATDKKYTQGEIDSIKSSYTSAKKDFEALESKYLDSDTSIASANSLVTAKMLAYQATLNGVIKAPLSGKVINLAVEVGDSIDAVNLDIGTPKSKPLLRISTLNNTSVKVSLSEIDISKVSQKQDVSLVFDAIPNETFKGSVSRVDMVGTINNAVVTYDVYVSLLESDARIRPGMSATVTIKTDPKKDVLIVPNVGLYKEEGQTYVQIKDGNSFTKRDVQIGTKNSTISEVISGLSEGGKILISKSK